MLPVGPGGFSAPPAILRCCGTVDFETLRRQEVEREITNISGVLHAPKSGRRGGSPPPPVPPEPTDQAAESHLRSMLGYKPLGYEDFQPRVGGGESLAA